MCDCCHSPVVIAFRGILSFYIVNNWIRRKKERKGGVEGA